MGSFEGDVEMKRAKCKRRKDTRNGPDQSDKPPNWHLPQLRSLGEITTEDISSFSSTYNKKPYSRRMPLPFENSRRHNPHSLNVSHLLRIHNLQRQLHPKDSTGQHRRFSR